jgi:hypothetical protein
LQSRWTAIFVQDSFTSCLRILADLPGIEPGTSPLTAERSTSEPKVNMLEQVVNERKESLEEITVRLRLKAMVGAEGFEPPMSQGRLIYSQVQYHSATHPISRFKVTLEPQILFWHSSCQCSQFVLDYLERVLLGPPSGIAPEFPGSQPGVLSVGRRRTKS